MVEVTPHSCLNLNVNLARYESKFWSFGQTLTQSLFQTLTLLGEAVVHCQGHLRYGAQKHRRIWARAQFLNAGGPTPPLACMVKYLHNDRRE